MFQTSHLEYQPSVEVNIFYYCVNICTLMNRSNFHCLWCVTLKGSKWWWWYPSDGVIGKWYWWKSTMVVLVDLAHFINLWVPNFGNENQDFHYEHKEFALNSKKIPRRNMRITRFERYKYIMKKLSCYDLLRQGQQNCEIGTNFFFCTKYIWF